MRGTLTSSQEFNSTFSHPYESVVMSEITCNRNEIYVIRGGVVRISHLSHSSISIIILLWMSKKKKDTRIKLLVPIGRGTAKSRICLYLTNILYKCLLNKIISKN